MRGLLYLVHIAESESPNEYDGFPTFAMCSHAGVLMIESEASGLLPRQGFRDVLLPNHADERDLSQKMDFALADRGQQFISAQQQNLGRLEIVRPRRGG